MSFAVRPLEALSRWWAFSCALPKIEELRTALVSDPLVSQNSFTNARPVELLIFSA